MYKKIEIKPKKKKKQLQITNPLNYLILQPLVK